MVGGQQKSKGIFNQSAFEEVFKLHKSIWPSLWICTERLITCKFTKGRKWKILQKWNWQKYGLVLEGAIFMKKGKYFHIIPPESSSVATCRKVAKEKDKMIRSRHVSQRSSKSINMWKRTLSYSSILYSSFLCLNLFNLFTWLYFTLLFVQLYTQSCIVFFEKIIHKDWFIPGVIA